MTKTFKYGPNQPPKNKPNFPPEPPTVLREDTEVKLAPDKQEKFDKALPDFKNKTVELHFMNIEKYENKDWVERLVVFMAQIGDFSGKSPTFLLERLSASMNATSPKSLLDLHQRKVFDRYVTEWMTRRVRS